MYASGREKYYINISDKIYKTLYLLHRILQQRYYHHKEMNRGKFHYLYVNEDFEAIYEDIHNTEVQEGNLPITNNS